MTRPGRDAAPPPRPRGDAVRALQRAAAGAAPPAGQPPSAPSVTWPPSRQPRQAAPAARPAPDGRRKARVPARPTIPGPARPADPPPGWDRHSTAAATLPPPRPAHTPAPAGPSDDSDDAAHTARSGTAAAGPAEPAPGRGRSRRRAARVASRREPEHDPGLAARAVVGNLVITEHRTTAWYHLPLQRWSFRSEADRYALIATQAARLADLAGRRCHLRITSRPFPTWRWAEALDQSIRSRHQPLRGPCTAHPWRSEPGCPACVPGHAWLDWLQAQQERLGQWGIEERDVYLGVELATRSGLAKLAGRRWQRAADAEITNLMSQAEQVTATVAAAGLDARPVTARQLQWLFIRSCALGLPAPLPVSVDPAPVPSALPVAAPEVLDTEDLGVYTDHVQWAAEPFGRTVTVTRSDGLTAHVSVLTVGPMNAPDLTGDSPWIQRTDRLPFPVEWAITFDVRDPGFTAKDMARRVERIRYQYAHQMEQEVLPPPAMERPHRLTSMLYGLSTVTGTATPRFLAYSISSDRVIPQSSAGAITTVAGLSAWTATSKRT